MPERSNGLDLKPGTVFGKFEVIRKLAVGGMAEIYLARIRGTAGFEKLVVLKRILPHIAQDPAFVQMFLDEARLTATLQHPNIADIYEVGEANGEVFFTMEYVHGQDVRGIRWASRKRDEPIPLAVSLAILQGVAAALDYAHDKRGPDGQPLGLVHRDVSSSNVMISYDGAIKLLDFGIARASNTANKTQTGTLKGKIPYMSPEQCRGHRLDRRSDLFSLGILMFELTVGRRPFRGQSDFEVMEQIVHHGPPRPSSLVKGYPAELEAILMKLLERKIETRYQTAEEMLHDLEPFLAGNRLWASPKQISKYMRLVFADRIEAWEEAQRSGVSLSEHIAGAPDQEVSEVQTPASAFPGLRSFTQEMPAVRSSSDIMDVPSPSDLLARAVESDEGETRAVRMTPAVPMAAAVPEPEPSAVTQYPELRSSSRRMIFIASGLGVGVIACVLVVLLSRGGKDKEPVADPKPATTETVPAVKPAEPPKAADKPVETKPEKTAAPLVDKPADTPVETADATTTKPEPVKPVVADPKPAARPVNRPVAGRVPVAKPKSEAKPKGDATKPKSEPDPNWDPNSPFLPGQ